MLPVVIVAHDDAFRVMMVPGAVIAVTCLVSTKAVFIILRSLMAMSDTKTWYRVVLEYESFRFVGGRVLIHDCEGV